MTEWWTYGLSDFLMFSPRTWYRLLELHNRSWWPLQPFLMSAGIGLLWSLRSDRQHTLRLGLGLLGALHLFVAWAFFWARYADINWGARYVAQAFALQGLLLLGLGLWQRDLQLARDKSATRSGTTMVLVAVLLFPILVFAWDRPLTQSEWFGLHPDPTTLATLGMVLCLGPLRRWPAPRLGRWLVLLIPLLWCLVSGASLYALGAPDWFVLPAAALATVVLAWRRPA